MLLLKYRQLRGRRLALGASVNQMPQVYRGIGHGMGMEGTSAVHFMHSSRHVLMHVPVGSHLLLVVVEFTPMRATFRLENLRYFCGGVVFFF